MNVLKTSLLAAAIALGAGVAPAPAKADVMQLIQESIADAPDLSHLPREQVQLVRPPYVHDHEQVASSGPRVVEFTIPIVEKEVVIDDQGTTLQAMTFGGSIPGPMMVVHEGDYVEITLVNPSTNTMPHNIDLHSATGAMGGGDITIIAPGEEATMRFKADRTGAFVYHCAPGGTMTPWHIMAGMHGTIMVLPREGLKDADDNPLRYDKLYYLGETDFYVPRDDDGNFINYNSHAESLPGMLEEMRGLIPSHVVFNGAVGALTGEDSMTAKNGETVMFVHSQALRDSRPHLIGGHGDYVWETGKFANAPESDLETWFVRGGSAAVALYTFKQPGLYAYVNHNLIEAIELGAAAHLVVEGDTWDHDLMTLPSAPGAIRPDTDLSLPVER